MQDRLTQSYLEMGRMNHASVAPAGEAWRKIIAQPHPFDLYVSDSSHPTIFGTYLTASVFYEVLFQKSVLATTFVTTGIPDSNARQLRQAAHSTFSDSIPKWMRYGHVPYASFTHSAAGAVANFSSTSLNGTNFSWNFGDSHTGTGQSSTHTYTASGAYPVTLTVYDRCKTSLYTDTVHISILNGVRNNEQSGLIIYPNPASQTVHIDISDGMAITDCSISFINSLGQIVKSKAIHNHNNTVDIEGLANGMYTIKIRTADSEFNYPLSVTH
jgi:PKD repeat protein